MHWRSRTTSLTVSCIATIILVSEPAGAVLPQQGQETLALGQRQSRSLDPQAAHRWRVDLTESEYVEIMVRPQGLDLRLKVFAPDGKLLVQLDRVERARWHAPMPGTWSVEVAPLTPSQGGTYDITWEVRRAATETDRLLFKADSLTRLAGTEAGRARYAAAEELDRRSLKLREQALGPDHPDLAIGLHNLAVTFERQGRLAEADSLYQRSLAIREKVYGAEHVNVAFSLNSLALLRLAQDRLADAERLYHRSLAVYELRGGANDPGVGMLVHNLAGLHYQQGRYGSAEPLYLRALGIKERTAGLDHPSLATTLNGLALVYQEQGRYSEAEPLLRRSLAIREKEVGRNHPNVAVALNNIAILHGLQGRYAEAELLHRRSLAIRETMLGVDHLTVATSLNNLGMVFSAQGRRAEAPQLIQRALAIREKSLGVEHAAVATTLHNLGMLYQRDGRLADAEPLLNRALAIWEKSRGNDHPSVAAALTTIASVYRGQRRFEDAESLYLRSLAIREKALGNEHPDVARSLTSLADLQFARGKSPATIVPLLDRAISILERTTGDPQVVIRARTLRAQVRRRQGDRDRAMRDLEEAIQVAEDLRPQVGGDEETRAEFFGRYDESFDQMVSWQVEAGNLERALEYAERGRARIFLDQIAAAKVDLLRDVPDDDRIELERREKEAKARLAEFQQRLNVLRSRPDLSDSLRTQSLDDVQDTLRHADAAFRRVYEEIKTRSPLWRDVITSGGQPVTLSLMQRRLVPPGGLLLLYQIGAEASRVFIIPPSGEPATSLALRVGAGAAAALKLDPGPLTKRGLASVLGRSPSGLSIGTGSRPTTGDQPPGQPATWNRGAVAGAPSVAELHALWTALIPNSLWSRLVKASEVIVVPDEGLYALPFEALIVLRGSTPSRTRYWLDDGPPIRYAPSATALYTMEQRPANSVVPLGGPSVLSLSDPIYDVADVARAIGEAQAGGRDTSGVGGMVRASGSLSRLPGTADETAAIRGAFGSSSSLTQVAALQRLDATEPNLRAGIPGKRFLHLATHGIVDQGRGTLFAALATTPSSDPVATPENDGFLQLHEIYQLRLSHVEMAALSACETNVGSDVEGSGAFALARGFLAAGARRVVASQWAVEDRSTAELMGDFFRRIAEAERRGQRVEYSRMLRDAKRALRERERWASPYFWAPFVLTGSR